jgi:hypothetical protein
MLAIAAPARPHAADTRSRHTPEAVVAGATVDGTAPGDGSVVALLDGLAMAGVSLDSTRPPPASLPEQPMRMATSSSDTTRSRTGRAPVDGHVATVLCVLVTSRSLLFVTRPGRVRCRIFRLGVVRRIRHLTEIGREDVAATPTGECA